MPAPRPVALLLEDEPLIAMDAEQTLEGAGFAVVTVTTSAAAHRFLDRATPAVAIVDIVLRDGPCHTLAERLAQRQIPFVVHSGDQASHHADTPFAAGTWLGKPAAAEELRAAVTLAAPG